MAGAGEKNWNRPWSMDEMIENAENWSLAGDVALLNTLKAYSEKLFTRTVGISDNVDNLLRGLDEVSLKLSLSQNEFQSLRNTQFIESRVYEDDETLDYKEEVKPEPKVLTEEEKEKLMKESVVEGLRVMDKYFEKIEVSISDSEDEESEKSYVLRPKDIYADRPLPLVIGTEEWYKKWHVGLADSSSESESEKASETYSESESGDDLPKDLMKGSETSSDFSSRTSENRPMANSTFNETAKKPDVFASDEESDGQGSVPVKTPISSKSFAEQLAAKLGDVISEREDVSAEINRKPIQPVQKGRFAGDLFSDEPPPLDDLEDTILPDSAKEGLFSGGRGLFDDTEDDLFWGQQGKGSGVERSDAGGGAKKGIDEKDAVSTASLPKPQVGKGPFDAGVESSDDEIFSPKNKPPSKQPFLQPYGATAPLFDDEPPELEVPKKTMEESKKKPVGGVSIFGASDLFSGEKPENVLKSRQQGVADGGNAEEKEKTQPKRPVPKSDRTNKENVKPAQPNLFDEDDDRGVEPVSTLADPRPQKASLFEDRTEERTDPGPKPKKISLFDDDDDLFRDDLFSGIATKKLTSNLFDDIADNPEDIFSVDVERNEAAKADLFGKSDGTFEKGSSEEKSSVKPKKNLSLFEEEEDGLFGERPTVPDANTSSDNLNSGNVEGKIVVSNQADEVDRSVDRKPEVLPRRQVIGAEKLAAERKVARGLFDEDLDLFGEAEVEVKREQADLFEENEDLGTDGRAQENRQGVKSEQEGPSSQPQTSETSSVAEKSRSKGGINLFGSTPPSDDDDWDAKSVQSSDNEDQFSYRMDYNAAGSSLFDNEPPSLGPNESSGIVRDENVTRMDTDDSSFNPYASSSRRLSSDLFSDQQSQDSFFVTKNKSESVNVPSQLDRIPEIGQSGSNLDITPSGNLEDLEDSKGDSSVFLEITHPPAAAANAKKPVSLFDDQSNDSADVDDLFSFVPKNEDAPKLSDKRLSLFDNIDNVLEEGNVKREDVAPKADKSSSKEPTKPLEPLTEPKEENVSTATTVEAKKPPTGSPGKLKHNLKINVGALMPGAAPPRLRDLPKSQSLDLPKDRPLTPTHPSSPDGGFFTPPVPTSRGDASGMSSEKAVSFEDALDNIEVLHSVTKDRARIPIKRRPSTRRGRQKAIHNASSDVTSTAGGDKDDAVAAQPETADVKPETTEQTQEQVSEPPKRQPDSAPLQPRGETKTPASDERRSGTDGLFDDTDPADGALFPGSVAEAKTAKGSIFESEDSDDGLFGRPGPKRTKREGAAGKVETAEKKKKKPLFNDSSSDEDLFSTTVGGGGGVRRRENTQKVAGKKPPRPSTTTRKLENIETDEDPLSSLLK